MENSILTIAINFISSKNTDKERVMHSRSDKIEIISHDIGDEASQQLFESVVSIYQIGLETSMKGSDFIFDCVCHTIDVIK